MIIFLWWTAPVEKPIHINELDIIYYDAKLYLH